MNVIETPIIIPRFNSNGLCAFSFKRDRYTNEIINKIKTIHCFWDRSIPLDVKLMAFMR